MARLTRRIVDLGVSPNTISAAGLLACLLAGLLMALTPVALESHPLVFRSMWAVAALLVLLRGLCNVLDGMVAIEQGKASRVGELWNELPDRLSDCAMLIGLGYAVGGWPTLGWAAALAAVLTAYVRAQCRAVGAPQDFCGPMAKPTRLGLVAAAGLAMAVLPCSWTVDWAAQIGSARGGLPAAEAGLPAATLLIILVGSVITAVRRAMRAGRWLSSSSTSGGRS